MGKGGRPIKDLTTLFVGLRHKRHLSDPSYTDITHATPTMTSLHPRPSASVGVSPAQNLSKDREERKRQKLAHSIEKERELSLKYEGVWWVKLVFLL